MRILPHRKQFTAILHMFTAFAGLKTQSSQSKSSNRIHRLASLLMLMVCTAYSWAQDPVEITTAEDIENNTKKLYLIQTNAFPSFYIAPQANNTITTNNILGEYMLWYFLDAGEDNGTQYYYIVNDSTGKYICHGGGTANNDTSRGVTLVEKTSSNEERCKFYIELNETNGTTGWYNIDAKGKPSFFGLNKRNGSEANQYPIRLTNDDKNHYINDSNSKWRFIPFNGTFTYPTPPYTPSTDSGKHYYQIHNYQKDTYYAATDATAEKVIFTNLATESRAWYFKEASSDTWYKYYYIINPATGGKYMYYTGTATDGKDQQNAVSVKTYDSANEDRYQFVVVQAARGDGASRKTCYAIIPKLLIDNLWTSSSIGYAQGSIDNGLNMGIINSRGASNGAHWEFITTTYNTVCANPVIAFDRTTGKASITTTTLLPSIYYTTDGTTPSSSNGILYNGPFALTEQTTVKAIVTKDGYTNSAVTTLTVYKVATPTIQQETGTHNVSITTTTPGATIYYTTDGTTPTTSSTLYTGASQDLGGKPIKAIAVKDGMINSDIGEGEIDIRCATPVISFDNATSIVTITCETEGSTIRYTTDNSEPTTTSTAYSGPFSVTSPTTVKAIATHEELDPSVVTELVITQVATPTIQNNGSNAVSITTATAGATIYYTTDGSTPTITSGTLYLEPLTEDISGVTIKAIAVKEGMITSVVSSGAVTLQCATPVIKRSGYDGFSISCPFPVTGVTIYYTTDGSTPTNSGTSISPGVFVPCSLPITVRAMAVATNYDNSEVATAYLKEGMGGEGTVDDPYTIMYQPDVADFIEHANTPEGASLHYKVIATEPLDFSGTDPVTQDFSGTFDGGTQPLTGLSHPLFNTVDGGVVKNVTLKNVAISSSDEYVGAIAGIAQGYSRIYNCGILPNDASFPEGTHPTVSGGTCAGGIVGKLDGDSRVINCYSYADVSASTYAAGIVGYNSFASTAEVSDGKYTNLKTAVVNCMFYGNITGGTNQYGVYGGILITNAAATGISSYNYYRSGSTFTTGEPTAYNCSFPADERYLTQVEFHRSLLNSNRELCGWWVGSDVAPSTMTTADVQAIPKDASLMYKWVVDPNLAPYPILKPFGKYPSIINTNTGTPWFDRTTANPFEGQQLGTLSVIIKSGSSAPDRQLDIPITDMDTLHYDFGYRKVQLPYYNTVFGNPDAATWAEKYAGNYTDQVVTGWKVTNVSGGTQGSFVADWQDGYNFADRNCTDKDLYSVSGRVFAQGGYYYVPDGVTEITIEAYWGKAIYVRNNGGYYDRVNITKASTGSQFAPAGTRDNNVNGATIQTTSIRNTLTAANIDAKKTVYDYALVLVGNVQESVGKNDVVHAAENTRGFTIMSVDLDFDEEPDYCLEWQLGDNMARQIIAPIRFDFLPVVELGIAGKLHNSTNFYSLGCYRSKGHFEVTETAFIRFGQFEFELGDRDEGPIILNGGIYDQYCRGRNNETNQHINYVILGGHIVMPSFTPGAHVNSNAKYQTRHCAVNVLGGDFSSFYLTGGYNEGINPYEDNPHCYIDGGRFGTIAAAYKEGIWGDVTWRINHALIGEFYGGGVMAQATGDTYKIVKGSIDVVIGNSIVGKYCGGPKFGDMVSGKTVTTSATGTTFNQYFGAGNGGTNYMQYKNTDATGTPADGNWTNTVNDNYHPGKYRNTAQGYEADYDIEVINTSTGDVDGKVVNRSYYYSAQFATTNTGNVSSTLTDCTINTNFYGGGFLGGVTGSVTSTLNNCTVKGSVFGAGYSASAGTVTISNKDKVPPIPNTYTGMIKPQSGGTSTTYYWTHDKGSTSKPITTSDGINYFYTEIPLDNLGSVSGAVTLTITGDSRIGTEGDSNTGDVYGGGDESAVNNSTTPADARTTVTLSGNTQVLGNVFGGGNRGMISGSTETLLTDDNSTTGVQVSGSVYGGGNEASVGTTGQSTQATVNISGENALVDGQVYGGCNSEGSVIGKSVVTITAGTVGTAAGQGEPANNVVFGGGKGQPTLIEGDVEVNIGAMSADETPVPTGSATINGSVYGGSAFGNVNASLTGSPAALTPVTGARTDVNIIGGTINGDAYGGGLGQDLDGTENDIEANVYGSVTVTTKGGSVYDVFGCNNILGTPLKEVTVNIQGGSIVSSVYGGGNLAAYTPTDAQGYLMVNIIDGTVAENVFGGGFGQSATVSANPKVTLTGGTVQGSVFGGGDLAIVSGMVTVDVNGGTVIGDVYGGGALANTNTGYYNLDAGTTSIADGVYTTQVNLHGGTVTGNVYGGGLGQIGGTDIADVKAYVGSTRIELNPGVQDTCVVQGNIFGCNNLNGTPTGGVLVHIYKTQGWAGHDVSDYKNVDDAPKDNSVYELAAVYGGGNLADYIPIGTDTATCVIIDGCGETSIRKVYGGGNAASTPATNVTVHGTYEIAELFGGGNGKDQINVNGTIKDNPGAHVGYKAYPDDAVDKTDYIYGTGRSNVTIYGGTIHAVYGGSDTKGNVRHQAVMLLDAEYNAGDPSYCPFDVSHTYGGGKNAPMDGQVIMKLECLPGLNTIYGGAENADVNGDVVLNITNGQYRQVFGGNNIGGQVNGAITINIEETGCQPIIIGELYGGGRKAPYSVYGYKFEGTGDDKVLKPRTSMQDDGTDPATPFDDPTINIKSFTSIGNVYGGGLGVEAVMVGSPHVNINVGYGDYNDADIGVYAGDTMQVDNADGTTTDVILPAHKKGDIGSIYTVYGGGNAADVIGDTYVNIGTETQVHLESTGQDIPVQGAIIEDNVYGGGNQADVTGSTHIQVGP